MNQVFKYVDDPHGYWLDGEELPSPSKVFQDLGLVDRRWFTPESRARGRAVHGYLHFALNGTLDWSSVDAALIGYVTSGMRLIEKLKPKIISLETPLYHPILKFAGTFDVEWEADGCLWVNDWKSGKSPKIAQVQTGAYGLLASLSNPGKFIRRCAIELFEDGAIANRVPHDQATDAAAWLNLLGAYRVRQNIRARELTYIGD